MESGEFSRGKENIRADGTIVMVGNFDVDVQHQQRVGHLFGPMPPEMRNDTAFLDRIHAYLRAGTSPRSSEESTKPITSARQRLLSECWNKLPRAAGHGASRAHLLEFGALSGRDIEAANKTVGGLLKLIHPVQRCRSRIRNSSGAACPWSRAGVSRSSRNAFGRVRNTHFSYTLGVEGVERFLSTPEFTARTKSSPIPFLRAGLGPRAGLWRERARALPDGSHLGPGGGVRILNQPVPPPFRESVQVPSRTSTPSGRAGRQPRSPRARFSIQLRANDALAQEPDLASPCSWPCAGRCSSKSLAAARFVVGALNLGGSIDLIPNAVQVRRTRYR